MDVEESPDETALREEVWIIRRPGDLPSMARAGPLSSWAGERRGPAVAAHGG